MTGTSTHAVGFDARVRPHAGTEVPMAHAIGREIIRAGLADRAFIERATSGYEEYRRLVEPWTPSLTAKVTGVPAPVLREWARACARGEPLRVLDGTEHEDGPVPADLWLLTGRGHGDRERRTPFRLVAYPPPVELTDERYPVRLTRGRRLDSSTTHVRKGSSGSSVRRVECVELSPEDAERYGVVVGEEVRVATRRGATTAPVWVDPALRPGLAFMTGNPPDGSDGDEPVVRASCPIVGVAEFEAAAIRIEKTPAVATRS